MGILSWVPRGHTGGMRHPSTLPARQRTARRPAEAPYATALALHAARDTLSLSVPGHGATAQGISSGLAAYFGERLLALDVPPLIEGIDLGADAPKARALRLTAEAWGARRSWFLTNGSSQANRLAALAVRGLGPDLVAQRSAHSSLLDGVILAGLRPGWIAPSIDVERGIHHGVTADDVRAAIAAHPGRPAAVYIVSPSYFGAVADVAAIADAAHEAGAALIVDAAWGAHFGFHPELPDSPARLGADLVVTSTHKLAGSLTQSAVLHLGDTVLADRLEPLVERAHAMTASTSESALLLASIDLARRELVDRGDAIDASLRHALAAREAFRADARFPLVSDGFGAYPDIVASDPFRIAIDVTATGLDGHAVRERLAREHGIQLEIATRTAVVAVVGVGKQPDLARVRLALHAIADAADALPAADVSLPALPSPPAPGAARLAPRDAFLAPAERVGWREAIGRVAADALSAYPPGIPSVLPGEVVTAEVLDFLRAVAASPAGHVRGAADPSVDTVRVVADS